MEFLRCAGCSQVFAYENPLHRPITLPVCGHTMCGGCILTFAYFQAKNDDSIRSI